MPTRRERARLPCRTGATTVWVSRKYCQASWPYFVVDLPVRDDRVCRHHLEPGGDAAVDGEALPRSSGGALETSVTWNQLLPYWAA
jgi:hypothetical protein